ncbi:MAG: bacteriohemerythrin [Gammaproteobacteria bacterium]|nr:bacteriohemerythrin [Gammaproteobacteria bacterium]
MQPFMEWSDNLNTGIDVIDLQHRKIVDYINELHRASQTIDRDLVGQVLNGLIEYTASHFAFEEEMLIDNHYGEIDEHKRLHQNFIERIKRHLANHEKGANVARALTGELQIWLIAHISKEDQRYVPSVTAPPVGSAVSKMIKRFFG